MFAKHIFGLPREMQFSTAIFWGILISMSSRSIIYLFTIVGSAIGSYLPVLWGGSELSFSSVFLGAAGGILGIWAGFRLSR